MAVVYVSLLCPICLRNWPMDDEYDSCPCCREDTKLDDLPAMTPEDADHQAAHGAFGWYLWEHDLV